MRNINGHWGFYKKIHTITYNKIVNLSLEAVCLEICKPNSCNFIVASVYRPPDTSSSFF
jgi:hypothetical protein